MAGSMLHLFWLCPVLRSFWTDTYNLIYKISGIKIPFTPKLTLLLLDPGEIYLPLKKLIGHILLGAKNLIARKWKSTTIPTLTELTQLVSEHSIFEKFFSSMKQ
ncbi:hypothetical protein GDO78_018138 [Eleutherodactylus coqui]|uniref:Uncharacterized protein n=1 Tax=Eleutherodactylus coqui TaxID=57060 RepID=A0A8J6E9M9_ELECQ|nr:hypothetical protein GDO78_018138 [Eleutherodactylus coqui]